LRDLSALAKSLVACSRELNLHRAKDIKNKGLTDLSRLEGLVPGFTFKRSGVDARPAIRGVRTESVGVNADTTIGFFIDGIYQSRSSLTWDYNENYSLQAFVTNVTDKATATRFVYGGGGGLQASYAPPRLWGVRGVRF